MVEFSKFILDRMSFNEHLFMKELKKLIIWSKDEKPNELRDFCIRTYGDRYGDQIALAFNTSDN